MKTPIRRASRTSISGAINFAMPLFEENPYRGLRRVIDISGDGPNNNGAPVTGARDAALEKGITINGLPIMVKEPSYSTMDIDNLDFYYEDCVIGGPGSFVVTIKDREKFKEAIRTKLVLEVAGRTPERRVVPVAGQGAAGLLHDRREDLAGPLGEVSACPGRSAARRSSRRGALQSRGRNEGSIRNGPGSAEQREERCTASGQDERLFPRLQHQIERRLRGAAETRQTALPRDLAQPRFAGLRAERKADLLRHRGRRADHGRCRIEQASHRR